VEFCSLLDIPDKRAFLDALDPDVAPIITGGDGTLSFFINQLGGENPTRDIYYYPAGTGNDFLNDLGRTGDTGPFLLNPYITDLPKIHFGNETHTFINGVGYGIDGYVCEEGDRVRKKTGKPINYTAAALKGLLYAYKRTNATVTVDGVSYSFKHVWMTPTMLGRFFGGGMMCAPAQDRLNPDGTVSLMVMRCASKLRTLLLFPSIFKGKHVRATKIVTMFKGHHIHVRFDRPTALQIDGEVFSGVSEYTVTTTTAEKRLAAEAAASGVMA
jgi:diacylglycerol kinase family enzyme